ncbi:reverse transcriptase family protein [Acinetobacter junii]|uniref:reverse transcriptase family protein n=1 Tax=Acinetobacter junii TaxID=40215 RepID=UPI001901AC95|nr:reverse transcriptase family protein [Acinetobacter junii]MBJ8440093.1 RNA-directed DNA polymerase [Acinetobacter junii]
MINSKFIFKGSKIDSLDKLSEVLSIDIDELTNVLLLEDEAKYRASFIQKSNGKLRNIYNPCASLRKIQRRIKNRIFAKQIEWPDYIFGSIPADETSSNDYVASAEKHCGARALLKLDIEDFFDNITQDLVENIFKNFFKYNDEMAKILAQLSCVDGKVPQGGITSSYIASLALFSVEERLFFRLRNKKLTYTRYIDDITISSRNAEYNFDAIIKIVESQLNSIDLPLNIDKIKVERFSSKSLKVHNIRVDLKTPKFDKEEVKNIRAAIHRLEKLVKKPNYRTHYFYRIDFNRCQGLVSKLSRVNHASVEKLQRKLNAIKPLPNKADIEFIENSIESIKKYFPLQKESGSFIYNRKFFKIQHRIGFLKSHPKGIYTERAIALNIELQKYRLKYRWIN